MLTIGLRHRRKGEDSLTHALNDHAELAKCNSRSC